MNNNDAAVAQRLKSSLTRTMKLSHHFVINPVVVFAETADAPGQGECLALAAIAELKGRGHRVAALWQSAADDVSARDMADTSIDVEQSWTVVTKQTAAQVTLKALIDMLGSEYDIIVASGFGIQKFPTFIATTDVRAAVRLRPPNAIGFVSEAEADAWTQRFSPNDIERIVDKIEEQVIKPYLASKEVSFTIDTKRGI
jgi:molybdopterin-guanine dinucleotide biosynthesis protein